jgi:hypothetical protein
MTADKMVLCYNKGCGKEFNPKEATDGEWIGCYIPDVIFLH